MLLLFLSDSKCYLSTKESCQRSRGPNRLCWVLISWDVSVTNLCLPSIHGDPKVVGENHFEQEWSQFVTLKYTHSDVKIICGAISRDNSWSGVGVIVLMAGSSLGGIPYAFRI